jgi:hypothetical protein
VCCQSLGVGSLSCRGRQVHTSEDNIVLDFLGKDEQGIFCSGPLKRVNSFVTGLKVFLCGWKGHGNMIVEWS